jgi:aspartyl aminopeptidase
MTAVTGASAEGLCAFVDASPSPFHVCRTVARRLGDAGYTELVEHDVWPGPGKYFVVRGGSIIAFDSSHCEHGELPAFRIVGGHTDSPNLRVKQHHDAESAGLAQVLLEPYGGAWLNSWLDRDLGVSGRIAVREGGRVVHTLVRIDEPLLRVPQLAIHLDRSVKDGLALDPQRHIAPVWSLGDAEEGALLRRVAAAAEAEPDEVLGWDLMLHDIQPPGYLGAEREFVVSSRLDNLVSVHAGITALTGAATAAGEPAYIPVLAAFDHEEVGSGSETGAQSPLLERVLSRSVTARGGSSEDWSRALAGAFCVSADMAHAVHPNYAERHDPDHRPLPNGGPTVKVNVNQRYATDSTGIAVFASACERAGAPWQPFVSNNAMPCGTSIGPLTAARLGVQTVDVGVPGLSMHSARELCGADDPGYLAAILGAFVTSD